MDFRILSIGTLAAHPLWNEHGQVRTGHNTTTLIRTGNRRILVDPGLPPQAIEARLGERAGITAADITDIFLTSFLPDGRRGLPAFEHAAWWISGDERERVGVHLAQQALRLKQLSPSDEDRDDEERALMRALEHDISILQRCNAAPDRLADHVDLFPLPGVTPGTCGLLLAAPRSTILICGDALPTIEHIERGQVLASAMDLEQAKESLQEALEIADVLIPGRDNAVNNPAKRGF
jgi:glyoxylase-like metal-dependent hydrolase (beta-lactamase superfamily II)